MEICHFFVIFYDFVMKCVYKSTIYTFVIRDKIWTPPFVVQKCTCYFCVLGPENTPPTPYMSGTFVLAPPPPPPPPIDLKCLDIKLKTIAKFEVTTTPK